MGGTRREFGLHMVNIDKLFELSFNFLSITGSQMVRRGIRKSNTKNEVNKILNRVLRWKAFERGKHNRKFIENNRQIK
jgi:hypothetical protein